MYKYHTLVLGLDAAVGMILQELDRQGVADNTIVIFAADNGYFNGSKGMGGKLYAYEEASLSPTIVFAPRRDRGAFTGRYEIHEALSGNIDIAPTILDYAGVTLPSGMQGRSLAPVLSGKQDAVHDSVLLVQVWGTPSAQSLAVVTKDHKYIHWFFGGIGGFGRSEELFDLRQDPWEQSNLVGDEAGLVTLEKMRRRYDDWLEIWAQEGVEGHGYPKYVRLADRHRPFENNNPVEIADMFNEKKDDDEAGSELQESQ